MVSRSSGNAGGGSCTGTGGADALVDFDWRVAVGDALLDPHEFEELVADRFIVGDPDDGTAAERPFSLHGERAYGPGVADMKSGLVLNCFVLAAIKKFEDKTKVKVELSQYPVQDMIPKTVAALDAGTRAVQRFFVQRDSQVGELRHRARFPAGSDRRSRVSDYHRDD